MPKTAKVYFSDFVMGSLCNLFFSVTASARSGGLKRLCTLKRTTAGKAEIMIAPVKIQLLWQYSAEVRLPLPRLGDKASYNNLYDDSLNMC